MKTLICIILFIISCIAMCANSIKMFAYQIQYPDTTSMRYMADNPDYIVVTTLMALVALISYFILFSDKNKKK